MASVRLSADLRQSIMNNAEKAFHVAHPEPVLPDNLGQELVAAITQSPAYKFIERHYHEQIELLNEYTDSTVVGAPSFLMLERVGAEECEVGVLQLVFQKAAGSPVSLSVKVDPPAQLFKCGGRYGTPRVDARYLPEKLRWPIVRQAVEYHDSAVARAEKLREYKNQVDHVLTQCNTLKQLLEVWPGAYGFIPEPAIEAMRSKSRSGRKTPEEIQFDSSLADSVAVKAQLKGGVK